jgi:myo-inositol catabolism protein IolC
MKLGYERPLYLMAFDHRASFTRDLFGAPGPLSPEIQARVVDVKDLIFEALQQASASGAPPHLCGVLVDEQFGSAIAQKAKTAGIPLAMPVEKSGQAEIQLEYGDDFGRHIEAFDPDFSKVLARYNPEGDRDLNRRQTRTLAALSAWLHGRQRRFLFELLVPPTPAQLERCGGHDPYDRDLRAGLVVQALRELQQGGVDPDIWKIEGLETAADCERVVEQARTGAGREDVVCIVLGRGASFDHLLQWLAIAAPVPGFNGFAVGRTLWQGALERYVARAEGREHTRDEIAGRYLRAIRAYVSHARGGQGAGHPARTDEGEEAK